DEFNNPGFITGKPVVLGGSHGRESATAKGVTIAIEEAAKKRDIDLEDARIVVQGIGNAGSFLAKFLLKQERKLLVYQMPMVHCMTQKDWISIICLTAEIVLER